MAESLSHIKYVERMVTYAESIPDLYVPSMMCADLPIFGNQTPKSVDGYYPDLFYYDLNYIIVGEAKTTDDIENDHTEAQLNSYIKEVRTYDASKHIILCTSIVAYAQFCNLIILKKRKEKITDITFHVIDNHLRTMKI